jgi:transposase
MNITFPLAAFASIRDEQILIPPSVDELIPANHLVQLVSEVIDEIGLKRLLRKYQRGGEASRYHPKMMTKLFVHGYMTRSMRSPDNPTQINATTGTFSFLT